jgi:hypothetical protein
LAAVQRLVTPKPLRRAPRTRPTKLATVDGQ